MNRTHRKYLASALLAAPAVVMFLENSNIVKDGGRLAPLVIKLRIMADHLNTLIFKPTDYILFSIVSLGVFVVSLTLALKWGRWGIRGSKSLGFSSGASCRGTLSASWRSPSTASSCS